MPLEGWTWGFPSTTQTNPATQTPPHSKRNKPAPQANPPPPDTTDTGNNRADCGRRRRIDRILIPAELQPHINGCYPSFLANSDHKMVTLLLAPNFATQTVKRKHCPTTFLSDEDVTDKIQSKLEEISLAGYSGWSEAMRVIRQGAYRYELDHRETGYTELQVLVHESSLQWLPPAAWGFLKSKGLTPKTASSAYSLLVSYAAAESLDRTGTKVLAKLKLALADPFESEIRQKRQDVWRLVKQLQHKRRLLSLRDRYGVILPDAPAIAKEITDVWSGTMASTGASPTECKLYLQQFFGKRVTVDIAKVLMHPLSVCLVETALESLNTTSSPGFDGFQLCIYKRFSSFFAPRMLYIVQLALEKGSPDKTWSLALLNPIPKALGIVKADELRPLVLQNTCHKWFAACIAYQLKYLVSYIIPIQQKGSLKGRFIFEHLWEAFGSWSAIDSGAFTFIDFSKAFDSVSHVFAQTFFEMLCIPEPYVTILIQLFRASIALVIHGSVQPESLIQPTSGVRQGCPLSPTLFAMLISPIITKMQSLSVEVTVLLYVDDLLIIISGSPEHTASLLRRCWEVMTEFQVITGLKVNPSKSAILVLGAWSGAAVQTVAMVPLPIKKWYKYLGVKLGDISPYEAYQPALQKAIGRAYAMQKWDLSLDERVALLQQWILSLLVFPAKVVYPAEQVISSLRTVYHIALRLNSWSLIVDILSLPKIEGGCCLPTPRSFLLWQHASSYVHFLQHPEAFSSVVSNHFTRWADKIGLVPSMRFLPYFQMGSNVVWQTMPFLGGCARVLSLIRQPHMVPTPEVMPYDLPLWHSISFRNEHQQSYFCPRLIRDGVLTWGGFLEDDTSQALIAPSWRSIYNVPKPQCHDGDPNLLNLDFGASGPNRGWEHVCHTPYTSKTDNPRKCGSNSVFQGYL